MSGSCPDISVIIPTYMRAGLLGRAIKSVLSQTYQSLELIVVDDCSPDNTRQVANSFDDCRVRYVRHDTNRGGSAARNTGIKIAKGEYICLLDDDDEYLPNKLERQIAKFQEVTPEVAIVYAGLEVLDANGKVLQKTLPQQRGNLYTVLLERSMISLPSPLIKKKCFQMVGLFDETLTSCQDWDMLLRMSTRFEFDFLPEILVRVHFHGDQISEDFSAMIPGRARMIEKHMGEFRKYPDILVTHLKRMGKMHCLNGTWKEAVYWFKKALAVNIFEIVNILAWCVIELPRISLSTRAKTFKKYHPEDE